MDVELSKEEEDDFIGVATSSRANGSALDRQLDGSLSELE